MLFLQFKEQISKTKKNAIIFTYIYVKYTYNKDIYFAMPSRSHYKKVNWRCKINWGKNNVHF